MKKINLYVFIQIIKSCTLVFFIFVSIAWLLQISRLLSMMNNLQIELYSIIFLSTLLIPNLINVTLPFIIIFGLVLSFIKLDKDKEIIAIYSLGLSINEIKKPLIVVSLFFLIIYLLINLFFSPYIYEKYKQKEFELRKLINFDTINITNFIELDNNLILDFNKNNDIFEDIFISYYQEGENIVFAKSGNINNENNKIIFNLLTGFKLNILNNSIEKLEFDNYKIDFPINIKHKYNNADKNTFTIKDLIDNKKYEILYEKIFDNLVFLTLIIFFYLYIIKENNFLLKNIFIYLILSIFLLVFQNLIKNVNLNLFFIILLNSINILLIYIYLVINKIKFK